MEKEAKKFLVYYNESKELIGIRQHHFDWEEGDVITTDGVSTVIFGIFNGTERNMRIADDMISIIKRYQPKMKKVRVADKKLVRTGDWFDDMMNFMVHSHEELVPARKKVWKDFDSQLDFVDKVFTMFE